MIFYRNFLFSLAILFLNVLLIGVSDSLTVPQPKPGRTCIIGAGISGLATARYLKDAGVDDFTIFEATKHVGGTWRFDPHIGTDEDGLPLFTSMYSNLRTNTPRQTMEFAGYPFPEGSPSYPEGTCFYKYVKSFAKKFSLHDHIKFKSYVTLVKRVRDHWTLAYTDVRSRTNHTEICDYVVVANGHYNKPRWPKIEGEELFRGKIMHSHDYKDPSPFANRRVLLVGAGPSGLDLATHLVNHTAKLIHSHHLAYNQPNFPPSYVKKPDIRAFTETGAVFDDDTFEEFDDVLYCTGFDFYQPFLDLSCGVTSTEKFILPLYQQVVNIRHPSMFFIGIAKVVITRHQDTQAAYAAAVITGKFQLPSQEEMLKIWLRHVYELQEKGKKIVDVNVVGKAQDQYFANLTLESGIERTPPVLTEMRDFNAKIRLDDLLHYRDYDFKILNDKQYERFYNPHTNLVCPYDD